MTILLAILRPVWKWIALALAVLGYGALQRRDGAKGAAFDAIKDTQERLEKGRDALRDGRGDDPADRLRRNDGKW